MTPEVQTILFALVIFGLRVLNFAIGTIRLVIIARQRRLLAVLLANPCRIDCEGKRLYLG